MSGPRGRHAAGGVRSCIHEFPEKIQIFRRRRGHYCPCGGVASHKTFSFRTDKGGLPLHSAGRAGHAGGHGVYAFRHADPIEETLLINENSDGLILKQLRYRTYGAGLPYLASEGRFREENGWFILDDMDRRFREVSIRNGVINNGTITVGNTLYRLPDLMPLGSELRLYIAPLYRGFWMKKEMR